MSAPTKHEVRAVVGIGASAGGLTAFTRFLKAVPAGSGMAFVLVQHLDPNHPSELPQILSSATKLPVTKARDGEPVRPDHVYVLPCDGLLTLSGGRLRVARRADGHPLVIDEFLTSLAADRGKDAIAVILSGSGSDGTKGVAAVKEAGGITFAQDPASAEHPDMARRAIESGSIDHVLPPEEIARAVLDPARRRQAPASQRPSQPASSAEPTIAAFEEIRALLHEATGVDFRHYKASTLRRRIERRLSAHGLADLPSYVALLRRDPTAVAALYRDALLHVTGFFRDPAALDALRDNVLAELVSTRSSDRPLRIWVPGCASGEEVYSIAICVAEAKARANRHFPIQIFGTDLTDSVLDAARRGWYPDTIASEVSPDRLERFFVRSGEGYQVAKHLREICTFSRHDITHDPPFARMDLISCRNVLIYFDPVLQGRVLRIFHYALNLGGFLMLGAAESPGVLGDLFAPRDRGRRIHVRQPGPARLPPAMGATVFTAGSEAAGPRLARRLSGTLEQAVADAALALASPGVVVNDELDILQFRGRTTPWLSSPPGEPTVKLLKMAHPDLRVPLGRLVRTARKGGGGPAAARGLAFQLDGREEWVAVRVVPVTLEDSDTPGFLIVFEALDHAPRLRGGGETEGEGSTSALVAELQRELVDTRDYLQSLIDEQDRVHAELQAAHEDSLSINEEFQSTNEELVTTKEEIQSINEELSTINEELRKRNTELQGLNTDLANVLESVDIPVIICDLELRLRRFSPKADELFQLERLPPHARLTEADLPIARQDLEELCRAAVHHQQAGSREVQDRGGRWHDLRSLPYRDADGRVVGVVLALVDIDDLRRALEVVAKARDYSVAIVETVQHPMVLLDRDLKVLSANRQFWRTFRLSDREAGSILTDLPGALWNEGELRERLERLQRSGQDFDGLELAAVVRDVGQRLFRISGRRIEQIEPNAENILLAIEDVTDRRLLEDRLQQASRMQAMGQIAGGVAHEINNQMQIATGFGRDLVRQLPPGDPRRADLEHILRAADRSADVTRNLLAFSRQQQLQPEHLIVDELVERMATFLPKLVGPAIEIALSLRASRRRVYADRAQLEQVFVNLALNARDAMPGGGQLRLETSAIMVDDEYRRQHGVIGAQVGPHVRIQVRDRGQGMDPEALRRVFEPFFTTKPVGKGAGLGMASVYGTVKQSSGHVWVDSRPGEGTTVTIDLPEATDVPDVAPKDAQPGHAAPTGSETILVVDDEATVRTWICRALETLGYTTLHAGDGAAALQILEGGAEVDLVLTDVVMPRMGGRELGRHLAKLRPGAQLVFISGHTRQEMFARGLLDERARFLTKPFPLETLAATIREVLGARPASAGP
ncbi:MAG TPA: chemotaxis protein CheB [Gemmatimonadales bacterium]|nr:chemotaxis protein CheB [Gemmatimonadales bacterium]